MENKSKYFKMVEEFLKREFIKQTSEDLNLKVKIKKILFLNIGLLLMAVAIALSIRCNMGTSPMSAFACVLSLVTPFNVGTILIFFNLFFVICEVLIAKSEFKKIQYFQVILSFVFGYFTNFTMKLTENIIPTTQLDKWILCIASCFIMALGIVFEVKAKTLLLPDDGILIVVSQKLEKGFGEIKVVFDVICVILAAIISYIQLGCINAIGIGTVVSAACVGYIVKFYKKMLQKAVEAYSSEEVENIKNKSKTTLKDAKDKITKP